MANHISNRDSILQALYNELVGPSPTGKEIDLQQEIRFEDVKMSYGPWRQAVTGDEILQRDRPTKRYGIGVLYPIGTSLADDVDDAGSAALGLIGKGEAGELPETANDTELLSDKASKSIDEAQEKLIFDRENGSLDDADIASANTYRPSSMGISFLIDLPLDATLIVVASGGRYHEFPVMVEGKERKWWARSGVNFRYEFASSAILSAKNIKVAPTDVTQENSEGLDIKIELYSRPYGAQRTQRLITVCLVNRKQSSARSDADCMFQCYFEVAIVKSGKQIKAILPYPDVPAEQLDDEEEGLALLYRNYETYAVGHGCAAGWDDEVREGIVYSVKANCLPKFETPSITPDIKGADGEAIQVSMFSLAGLDDSDDGFAQLESVVDLYEKWVEEKQNEISTLEERYQQAATRHLEECSQCVLRMRDGLIYLQSDPLVLTAFQFANQAILLQQVRSRREPRFALYDEKNKQWGFSEPYTPAQPIKLSSSRGQWRAFQIAFLLMCLRSTAENDSPDRKTIELIWFPTGGGKTEAYLGLAAFSLFMRRLRDINDVGVHVLMRYTLRLLTAQQFQRACGLVCAMDYIRQQNVELLGDSPFSIGIWVGGSNTPNNRQTAINALRELNKPQNAENPFILSRCPWCGAQMGVLDTKGKGANVPKVLGYERQGNTVIFKCPDSQCDFVQRIPVYVIDEDIYDARPSLIIGTVDKFAMLAWNPDARTLFGIGSDGEREYSPPGLIIQDELHLISGPLGSMVGLYEAVIEELCVDRRQDTPIVPKIISSTATIRRYKDQIKALYGRHRVTLFPPPGLDAGDSFFARYATEDDGSLSRGRLYVGVHAPGLGSLQTVQVRSFTALLQAPVNLSSAERDPWWTLLLFFNSLRELGTTLSLFQSDIPDYLKVTANRLGLELSKARTFWELKELTGRLRSDEVPQAIAALEVTCTNKNNQKPVDVCLASNILEVGIDIDRLSLMAVVGQPKATSQYIQVTGRVGRNWRERPGLVITIYMASKPRDRSHFERFRSYHERLYAQVEPTSVTPFSPPALDRALHAALVAYVRQRGNEKVQRSPYPFPEDLIKQFKDIILSRVTEVDEAEIDNVERVLNRRMREWEKWQRTKWETRSSSEDLPLLRQAGAYIDKSKARLSWSTPMSMRNVDAECRTQITQLYIDEED